MVSDAMGSRQADICHEMIPKIGALGQYIDERRSPNSHGAGSPLHTVPNYITSQLGQHSEVH